MTLYVPSHFAVDDRKAIVRLMHDYPFATLVTPVAPEPFVTHIPLVHVADCEPHGSLLGHFARANPHVQGAAAAQSVAVFNGPHAYVSPAWYAQPAHTVPTWNYAVVHVHGSVELATEPEATRAIIDLMISRFESHRAVPWQLGLHGEGLAAMIGAIIGFRLRIRRIDAKFKMSQNRSPEDQARVADALADEGSAESAATAQWMRAAGTASDGAQ